MTKSIGHVFDAMCQRHWLKMICREADKYNKLIHKSNAQARVVHIMVRRYNELYPDDALKVVEGTI